MIVSVGQGMDKIQMVQLTQLAQEKIKPDVGGLAWWYTELHGCRREKDAYIPSLSSAHNWKFMTSRGI